MGSAPANKIIALKTADSAIRVSPKDKALGSGREERVRGTRLGCRGKVGSAVSLDGDLCTAALVCAGVCGTNVITDPRKYKRRPGGKPKT